MWACPTVDIRRLARCDVAGFNPNIPLSFRSDTLVLKPDTVLLTNLCKRLSQRINPSYRAESALPNNTVIWSCPSGCPKARWGGAWDTPAPPRQASRSILYDSLPVDRFVLLILLLNWMCAQLFTFWFPYLMYAVFNMLTLKQQQMCKMLSAAGIREF